VTPGAQQPANAPYSGQENQFEPAMMVPRPALPGPSHHVGQPRVFRMIGEADEYIDN